MVKQLFKLTLLSLGFSFLLLSACKKERVPIVKTADVTKITAISAVTGGNVTEPGIGTVEVRGVCWSRERVPTVNNHTTSNGSGLGGYTSSITGLTPNTKYYVRAYAINKEGGIGYGEIVDFTTQDPPDLPSVITANPSDIYFGGAMIHCSIPNDGGGQVTRRGLCYSTSPNPTLDNRVVDDGGDGSGFYMIKLDGLEYFTLFYVRAFATNSTGTAYGNQMAFTTKEKPSLGDPHGGGVIGYLYQQGDPGYVPGVAHGIVSGADDEGFFQWGCIGMDIPGTSTALWTGQVNTEIIMNECGQSGNAAFACSNTNRGGNLDWFLPSVNELQLLFQNKSEIGNFTNNLYWSSSAASNNNEAYALDFSNGIQMPTPRNTGGRVRAIRYF